MNIIVKVNEFFFSLLQLQLHLYPQLLRRLLLCLPHPFPLVQQHHSRLSRILIFFLWRRRLLWQLRGAVVVAIKFQLLLHFSHTTRAACRMPHAASCVLRRQGDDNHVKCQMGNGKL